MRSIPLILLAASAMFSAGQAALAGAPADLIVHNAVVYTTADGQQTAEGIAIRGRTVRGGRDVGRGVASCEGHPRGSWTRAGQTIVPGLQDAHGHVSGLGEPLEEIDLRERAPSRRSSAKGVPRASADVSRAIGSSGRGWDQNRWPVTDWPAPGPLDDAAPENPVFLIRIDGHAALANRSALAAAGITRETPDPAGGRLIRDRPGADGRTGGCGALTRRTANPAADHAAADRTTAPGGS